MGTETGRLEGHGFQGTVTAGDRSSPKGEKLGGGDVDMREKRKDSRGRWDAKRKDPAQKFQN